MCVCALSSVCVRVREGERDRPRERERERREERLFSLFLQMSAATVNWTFIRDNKGSVLLKTEPLKSSEASLLLFFKIHTKVMDDVSFDDRQ